MRYRRFVVVTVALCAAFVLFTSTAALAAPGKLKVTVFTQSGKTKETIPGAQVALASKTGKIQPKAAITDIDGVSAFENLPPDEYSVTISFPGYSTVTKDIKVGDGQAVELVITLLAEITEQVTVVGKEKTVELDKGAESSTSISAETFADLPVAGREYQQVLTLAPGVQDSDGDGNPNIHGSRERDFKMDVDGVSNVDPLTGQFQGNINPDAIEEIQVVESGADASFGGAVGGFGRITTKTGGNQFEANFNLFFRNSLFDNDGAGGGDPQSYQLFQPSVYLSGPVVKDHLWYMLSQEYLDASFPIQVVGGQSYVQEQTRMVGLYQLTWQVSPKNRLQLQYRADPFDVKPTNVDSITPIETGAILEGGGPTYTLRWTAPYSPTFFFEALVGYSHVGYDLFPFDPNAVNSCGIAAFSDLYCTDLRTQRRSGPYFVDYSDDRERWTYKLDAEQFVQEWLGGSHRIKGGFAYEMSTFGREQLTSDVIDINLIPKQGNPENPGLGVPTAVVNYTTFYPFDSMAEATGDYYALYLSDTYDPLPNLSVTLGARYSREEIESSGFVGINASKERQAYTDAIQACWGGGANNTRRCAESQAYLLTFAALDNPDLYPTCVSAPNLQVCELLAGLPADERNYRQPEALGVVNNNLSPRLSASWDPANDGKTKLSGSWGRFYGDTFLLPFVSENGPDRSVKPIVLDQYGEPYGATLGSGFAINQVARDIRSQKNDEWTLAVEREIAPETTAKVRYVSRKYVDLFQDVDSNHRPVYWDELTDQKLERAGLQRGFCRRIGEYADCTGALQSSNGKLVQTYDGIADLELWSPAFSNVYDIDNNNYAKYKAIILEIERRFFQNWEARMSYTWSQSYGQAEDFAQGLGDDPTTVDDEEGPLSTDQRHVVKFNGRVFVPYWGGFRLGAAVSYETGLPYSLIAQRTVLDFPTDVTGGVGQPVTFQYSTPRTIYPTGQRNSFRNSPFWDFNVNFQKEFPIGSTTTTFQLDIFNLLNDNTEEIQALVLNEVQDNITNTTRTVRTPIATRRFGRQFQVAFKVNF
jgi:hypothetical protein